jgi:replication factor C small subunit
MDFQDLWVEKYRPRTLNDILLVKDIREFFENLAKAKVKTIPHLMFHGPAGGGKTSLAKILVEDVLKCEYLYLNGSEQNSIDTVRGVITNFIQTKSFDGGIKVVILDEADGLSSSGGGGSSAQQALRNIMEEYAKYSRFILTCNYGHKIIEPIWSRVQAFYICPDRKDYIQRCLTILKAENVTMMADKKQKFLDLVNDCYPDLRKAINELQKFSITNTFNPPDVLDVEVRTISKTCFDMLEKKTDMVSIRKYIIENEQKFKADYNVLLKNLFEDVYDSKLDLGKKRNILLKISEALYYNQIVLDKEINFFATCIKIGDTI